MANDEGTAEVVLILEGFRLIRRRKAYQSQTDYILERRDGKDAMGQDRWQSFLASGGSDSVSDFLGQLGCQITAQKRLHASTLK